MLHNKSKQLLFRLNNSLSPLTYLSFIPHLLSYLASSNDLPTYLPLLPPTNLHSYLFTSYFLLIYLPTYSLFLTYHLVYLPTHVHPTFHLLSYIPTYHLTSLFIYLPTCSLLTPTMLNPYLPISYFSPTILHPYLHSH